MSEHPYDNLDAMIELAISSGRFEMATGMLLATCEIASEELTSEMRQKLGEKLIELQILHYTQIGKGTREILAMSGFDDDTVKEILENAQAEFNERGTN